jgi:hypothetical protein
MIPHPYVIIAFLLALGATAWRFDTIGYNRAIGEQAAQQKDRQDKAIEKANQTATADTAAAVKVETRIVYKRDIARENRHALELDIERQARARAEARAKDRSCPACNCGLDAISYQLLLATIRAANGAEAPGPGKPPAAMPADPRAEGRKGGDHPPLDRRPDPALRRVPRQTPGPARSRPAPLST